MVLPMTIDSEEERRAPGQQPGGARPSLVALAIVRPHLHVGARSFELTDAVTNGSICRLSTVDGGIVYGRGADAEYIVAARPCAWGLADAPRIPYGRPLRAVVVYDAQRYRMGVMAQFNAYGAVVEREGTGRV